jgi:ribosomal protein S18 acetylase RimI-like enzyme
VHLIDAIVLHHAARAVREARRTGGRESLMFEVAAPGLGLGPERDRELAAVVPRRGGLSVGMGSSIEVRNANAADAGRISVLLTALAEEFIVGEFSEQGRLHLLTHFGVTKMEERLEAAEYRFQVAEDGAVLAGVVAVRARTHLQYLFVARSHQRSGLARRLWDLARLGAIRDGNAAGRFTVNASGYAVAAYERLGFRCVGPVREANSVWFQRMECGWA